MSYTQFRKRDDDHIMCVLHFSSDKNGIHLLILIMYVWAYNCIIIGPKIQAARQEAKVAVAEYHEKHGISAHH